MRSSHGAYLIGLLCCYYGAVGISAGHSDIVSPSALSQLNSHREYSSYDQKRDVEGAAGPSNAALTVSDQEPVRGEFVGATNLKRLPDELVNSIVEGDDLLGKEETHSLAKSRGRKRKKKRNRRKHNGRKNRKHNAKFLFGSTLVEHPRRRLTPADVNLRWNELKNAWESTDTRERPGRADVRYHPGTQTTAVEGSGTSRLSDPEALSVKSLRPRVGPSRKLDLPAKEDENMISGGTPRESKVSSGSHPTAVKNSEDEVTATSDNNQWKVFSSIRFDTYRADEDSVTTSKPIVSYGIRDGVLGTVRSYSTRNYRFNLPSQRALSDQGRTSPSRARTLATTGDNSHQDSPSRSQARQRDGSSSNVVGPGLRRPNTESNIHESIHERILRNRYWSRRNRHRNRTTMLPRTTSSLADDGMPFGVDNSSGNLLNPFDQIFPRNRESLSNQPSRFSAGDLSRTHHDSNGFRNTGYGGGYSSDNHFSLTINSTLSTPHYYRALNNINKPITPYNWRRRKLPQSSGPLLNTVGGLPAGTPRDILSSSHDSSFADQRLPSATRQNEQTRNLGHDSKSLSSISHSNSSGVSDSTNDFMNKNHTVSSNSVFHRNARSFDADPLPQSTPYSSSLMNASIHRDSLNLTNGSWFPVRPSPYTQLLPSASANQFSSNANPFQVNSTPYRYRSSFSQSSQQFSGRDNQPETERRFTATTILEDDNSPFRGGRGRTSGSSLGSHSGTTLEDDSAGTRTDEGAGAGEQKKRPNIVVIITDDLDVELGSLNYMPRLHALLRKQGGLFPHSYTSTPMCCPSRSSLLTGMYIHNHEVYTNNDNCSSVRWQETHEQRTFATYLSQAGYNTGYFGKYLNKYKGPYTPAGWRDWMGLRLNSRYYNYTVYKNGQKIKYGDSYPRDYFPNVITNEGIRFLRENFDQPGGRPSLRPFTRERPPPTAPPLLMVLSYPAPHGPEDSAPEYSNMFFNATDHHTVAYDYAPNPDKQWILQYAGRLPPIKLKFTDLMMTKRLQTLQSVDQAIERIVTELRRLDQLSNTYLFFTSDHGYHLGQFGLIKGKSMPFEFDIKVPLLVRGPGVVPSTEFAEIALNVDLAPTFLDIGGVSAPPHMDGRSLLPLLTGQRGERKWRDSFLVESSGRHRDEDVLEMRAQKRFLQLSRLRDREVELNTTLATIAGLLSTADSNQTIGDHVYPLLNNSLFSSVPDSLNMSGYLPSSYPNTVFNSNQSGGSFEVDLAAALSSNSGVSGGQLGDGWGGGGQQVPLYTSKHEHLEEVCKSEELQTPCDEHKKWRCEHDGDRWRLKKCRPRVQLRRAHCVCGPEMGMGYLVRLDQEERRRQRTFLRQHASQDLRSLSPRFLKAFVDVDSSEVARENLRHRHARKKNRTGRMSETSPEDLVSTRTDEVADSVGRRTKRNRRDVDFNSGILGSSTTNSGDGILGSSTTNSSDSGSITGAGRPRMNFEASQGGAAHPSSELESPYLGDYDGSYGSSLPESSGDLNQLRTEMATPSPDRYEQGTYSTEEEEEIEDPVSGVVLEDEDDLDGVPDLVHSYVEEEELKDIERQIHDIFDELKDLADASGNNTGYSTLYDNSTTAQEGAGGCVAVGGAIVDCPPLVYRDKHAWRTSKHAIDEEIRRLGQQMRLLKVIRQHLRESRPRTGNSRGLYSDYDTEEGDEHPPELRGSSVDDSSEETATDLDGERTRDPAPSWGLESHDENRHSGRNTDGRAGGRGKGGRRRPPLEEEGRVAGGSSAGRGRLEDVTELGSGGGGFEDDDDGGDDDGGMSPTTERVFGWNLGYDVTEGRLGAGVDGTTEGRGGGEEIDPDHFTYTGGYRGKKGSQVAVYVPRDRSVCWCNKRAALQQHVRTEKLRRMAERQRLRELRAAKRLSRRKEKQQRRRGQRHHKEKPCNLSHQNCYHHDNDHWKTPPLWTDGSFCACLNAANNTYWCVRTINITHNTLYCEFITGLITYYDLNIDPYQLRNVAFMLDNDAVAELHDDLTSLRSCRGVLQCDLVEGSRYDDPPDDVNASVILPSSSTPTAGTSPFSSSFINQEDLFTNEVTSPVDTATRLRVSLYASDEHFNDTEEEEEEEEDDEDGYGRSVGTQQYNGAGSTPELKWDRLGLYPANGGVRKFSNVPVVSASSPAASSDTKNSLSNGNDNLLRVTPAGRVVDNEVTFTIADDVPKGRYFRTGRRNKTKAYKANRWAFSNSRRNGSAFDVTDIPYDARILATQRLNGRRNGGGSGRGNSSKRGFRRFPLTNLEGGFSSSGNRFFQRGVGSRRPNMQGDVLSLPDEGLIGTRRNDDLFSSGLGRGVRLEGGLLEEGGRGEGRDSRREGRQGSVPGKRRRPKKEQKKRRKEMRRLRKEQKRKRLNSLLGESSPDPVRALSGSSLKGVTRLPRRSREERRRLRRWRRFEKKLKQLTETGPSDESSGRENTN